MKKNTLAHERTEWHSNKQPTQRCKLCDIERNADQFNVSGKNVATMT